MAVYCIFLILREERGVQKGKNISVDHSEYFFKMPLKSVDLTSDPPGRRGVENSTFFMYFGLFPKVWKDQDLRSLGVEG